MEELRLGLLRAVQLVTSLDPEVVAITTRSLAISATSCCLATLISIPLGTLIHFSHFSGKRAIVSVIQTLFSVPTVVVGLLVFVLFSRAGPWGGLDIMFTPTVMVIGQVILILPLMLGLVISALSGIDKQVPETAISLGASRLQTAIVTLREARYAVLTAVIMGFGRALSLGFEAQSISVALFEQLQENLQETELVPIKDELERLRGLKGDEEITLIKQAVHVAEEAWEKVMVMVKQGTKEDELALELEYCMKQGGAEGTTFDIIVAAGPRAALPHAQPTKRTIEEGDFVLFDFGARHQGYCCDESCTVVVGRATLRHLPLYVSHR